jgi:TonB family C-terminal domain
MKSIALLLLVPMSAWAQSDTTTPPRQDYGFFSNCLGNGYPPDAFAAHIQGSVEVNLRVTTDGQVRDVVLAKSSGNESLDRRTKACFEAGRYKPATQNGQAVAVSWHEKVDWTIEEWQGHQIAHVKFDPNRESAGGPFYPQAIGKPHICIEYYPPLAVRLRVQGTTTLGFTITTEGTTADVKVKVSSGDQSLDEAALTCARQWIYKPAMKDGKPVAVPWKAEVRWSLH